MESPPLPLDLDHLPTSDDWLTNASDPDVSGACRSPQEAFASVLSELPKLVRDRWWRHRWRRITQDLSPTDPHVAAVVARCGTTVHRLAQYLHHLSSYSDASGSDPVFCYRKTLAENLGCSIATIKRVRRAAVELGFHTSGDQIRWINESKPGDDPWCGGPAVIQLTLPIHDFTLTAKDQAARKKRAAARHRAAQERRQHQRDEAQRHRERLIEAAIAAAPEPPKPAPHRERPAWMNEALAQSRAALE